MTIEKNNFGYIWQKGNRYFCKVGATTYFNSGFKSFEQFENWIEEEFKKHGLDWRAKYAWKYRDCQDFFILVNRKGEEVK